MNSRSSDTKGDLKSRELNVSEPHSTSCDIKIFNLFVDWNELKDFESKSFAPIGPGQSHKIFKMKKSKNFGTMLDRP